MYEDDFNKILLGQAAQTEMIKTLSADVKENRDDLREIRTCLSEYNMAMSYAQAEIKHLRDDHEKTEKSFDVAMQHISDIIKDSTDLVWTEKRRCKEERCLENKRSQEEIINKVMIQINKMQTKYLFSVLIWLCSLGAIILKEIIVHYFKAAGK